jgi:UDP-N-acetyl-D-mannosaminuronic acid dehydrogenase
MKKDLSPIFLNTQATIKEAMQTMTEAPHRGLPAGLTLVTGKNKELLGIVTDGDIRKALVRGVEMSEKIGSIMTKDPITVPDGLSVDDMLRTVSSRVKASGRIRDVKVDQIIVTDKDKCVVDIFEFYDLWHKQEVRYKKLCVVGTGHVGLTMAVVLADLGYQVTGFDINEKLIERLKKGDVPFFEKGLPPLLKFHLKEEKLKFVTELKKSEGDVYIISVGTPVDEKTLTPIDTAIRGAALAVGKVLKSEDIVILRSTVTVGTTRNLVLPILEKASGLKAGVDFYLVFAPERVVEGKAIEEMKQIPQIIGGINKKSAQEAAMVLQTVSPSAVMLDSLEEAELIKLINNCYRDYSFAFANKMAQLCNSLNLDAVKLIRAASEGYVRNPVPLPSPGVGGYCLTKDPYLMAHVAKGNGVSPDLFVQGRKINEAMPQFVGDKVIKFIKKNYAKAKTVKIYCLGLAFKGYPETSDMRGSPALDIVSHINKGLGKKVQWYALDHVVKIENIEKAGFKYALYNQGFANAHAVLVLNNHPEFAKMDIFTLLDDMQKPGLFLDGWYFFPPKEVAKVDGIVYEGLGGFNA